MLKHELEQLIEAGMSTYEIATKFAKSQCAIRYWLAKHGLKTKHKAFGASTPKYLCKECGAEGKDLFAAGKPRVCKKCLSEKSTGDYRRRRSDMVEYKGGKCVICGYNRTKSALHMHHVDPDEKDPRWNWIRNRSLENLKEELDKCVLVCANCHAEIHDGMHDEKLQELMSHATLG